MFDVKKIWHDQAWEDYLKLQGDKKLLKKINSILRDIERGGYEGIGKPEPLKDNLSGYWSRRIDDYNRIVYKIDGEVVEIVQCGTHYHCVKKLKMCIHTLQFGIGYFAKKGSEQQVWDFGKFTSTFEGNALLTEYFLNSNDVVERKRANQLLRHLRNNWPEEPQAAFFESWFKARTAEHFARIHTYIKEKESLS